MKTLLSLTLIFSILVNNLALADDAVSLTQGQPAPYAGVLLSQPKADLIKKQLIDSDYNAAVNESLNKSITLYKSNEELYQKKIDLYSNQNDRLATELYSERQTSDWTKALWFILGIAATSAALYGAKKLTP